MPVTLTTTQHCAVSVHGIIGHHVRMCHAQPRVLRWKVWQILEGKCHFQWQVLFVMKSNSELSLCEQVFQLIQSEKIKNDYTYLSWLARCCKLFLLACVLVASIPVIWVYVATAIILKKCIKMMIVTGWADGSAVVIGAC